MALVNVNPGESIESALRRFKRKVMTEEIIKDLKKHQHFIPPGQKAKLKSANARKRNRRKGRPRMMNNQQGGGQQQNQMGGSGAPRPQGGGFNRE
jgi:small subunit ribosomal protein S21